MIQLVEKHLDLDLDFYVMSNSVDTISVWQISVQKFKC